MNANRDILDAIIAAQDEIVRYNGNRVKDDKPELTLSAEAAQIAHRIETLIKERIGTIGYKRIFPDAEEMI